MSTKLKILFLFAIHTNIAFPKNPPNLDSLILRINFEIDDYLKIKKIFEILELQKQYYYEESFYILTMQAKKLAERLVNEKKDIKLKNRNKALLSLSYVYCGEWHQYYNTMKDDSAFIFYQLAIKTNREARDLRVYGIILTHLGQLLEPRNKLISYRCYEQALNVFEKLQDKNWQAKIQYKIAKMIYPNTGSREIIIRLEKALKLYKETNNYNKIAFVGSEIATTLSAMQKSNEAIKYFNIANEALLKIQDTTELSSLLVQWAFNDFNRLDTNSGYQKLTKSYRLSKRQKNDFGVLYTLNHIRTHILIPRQLYKELILNIKEQIIIAIKVNDSLGISILNFELGNLSLKMKKKETESLDKTSSFVNALKYYTLSLNNLPKDHQNLNGSMLILFSSEEFNLNKTELYNGKEYFSIPNNYYYLKAEILKKTAICMSKLNKKEMAFNNLLSSIEITDSLNRLSQTKRKEKISFERTKSELALEIKLQNERINNESKRKEIYAYGFGIFTFISLILAISIYRGYRSKIKLNKAFKTIQETQEKLINQEKLSFEEKLAKQKAEQEMQLLRAQMNPHFLFNSLNSIHNCILQKDTLTVASSLTKFSRLVRYILESSRHAIVTLKSELATLELYMQLEQMRFNTKFEYKIIIESGMSEEQIVIPPLILQPFIENSIWHGLLPSGTKGLIEISIRKNEDKIFFTISDNGIGRDKSKELNKNRDEHHTSYGLEITKERLQHHNKLNAQSTAFTIIDLYDNNGNATGTKVEFELIIQKNAA